MNLLLLIQQATPSHDNTQIVHLEAQLKVYQEDFECERRDREAAQTKISELENELSLVTRQVRRVEILGVSRGVSYTQHFLYHFCILRYIYVTELPLIIMLIFSRFFLPHSVLARHAL